MSKKIFTFLFLISYAVNSIHSQNVTRNLDENGKTLNFSFHELKERCESKIVNISQILKNLNSEFSKELSKVSKRLWDINIPDKNTNSDKISSSPLLKSRCYEKSKFEKIFENAIGIIHFCFENDFYLKAEEIKNFSKSAASQICAHLELESLIKMTDNECAELINNNKDCFPSTDNITGIINISEFNIFYNLKIERTTKECKSLSTLWNCQQDVIKSCKNSTIKMHETWIKNQKSFTKCDKNKTAEKQSIIFDEVKERFNFTIPELLRICQLKGINLKDETDHINFHVFDLFLTCSRKINSNNFAIFPNELIKCMRKSCYSNVTLQFSFEKVIDSIQFCFNDFDQISLRTKKNLAQTSVQAFCDKMLMGELALADPAGTFSTLENCYEKLEKPEEELSNFFVLLSVPHIYTQKQCSYYAGLFACAKNEFSNSSNETKAAIEAVRLRLSNCDRIPSSIFT